MVATRVERLTNPEELLSSLSKQSPHPYTTTAQSEAARKAWSTMRRKRLEKLKRENLSLSKFVFSTSMRDVDTSTYVLSPPLIKKSALTTKENGGVGKYLSDGWAINYAIGCTHACRFCYVDVLQKFYGRSRAGNIVSRPWGNYFSLPVDMDRLIEETNWSKWSGVEVMMSSMHDPYLPQLVEITRKILEAALPAGVHFCIQTRSPLASRDFSLLAEHKDKVRLQVSIATLEPSLARLIEPRVAPPAGRLELLRKAKSAGLRVGVILAPILPPVPQRKYPIADMNEMMSELDRIGVKLVYGECIHRRGSNMGELEAVLGSKLDLQGFDAQMEKVFNRQCRVYGFDGTWWREFH